MSNFENRRKGGHPNSLGNTMEIVEEVLAEPSKFDELFHCYFSDDETVRLRTSNAMKRVCKEQKPLLIPYIDRFLGDISKIDQASTQWTLSQLFLMLENDMTPEQHGKALEVMKGNLAHHSDWIVLNTTMDTLGQWARRDQGLEAWLIPHLERLSQDPRKSIAKRSNKLLNFFIS